MLYRCAGIRSFRLHVFPDEAVPVLILSMLLPSHTMVAVGSRNTFLAPATSCCCIHGQQLYKLLLSG